MAIRRLNYTDRQRLLRDDTLVTLRPSDTAPASFDVALDLDGYSFPPDTTVLVEAYRQSTCMRFDFGAATAVIPPPNRVLGEFSPNDTVLFRVKVIGKGERHGQILAEGDRIRCVAPDGDPGSRIPLLPVESADLGQLAWRLDFGADDEPRLLINSDFGDWRSMARAPEFMLLVYPAIVEQVLTKILLIDEHRDVEDANWRSLWLRFAATLVPNVPKEEDADIEAISWIQEVVRVFSRKHRLMQRLSNSLPLGSNT